MNIVLATLACQPVRLPLPSGEGMVRIERVFIGEGEEQTEITPEALAQKFLEELKLSHAPHCKGEIRFQKISEERNVLVCAGCFMRLVLPGVVATAGELVRHVDELRREARGNI